MTSVDSFKAIGVPIMLFVILLVGIVLTFATWMSQIKRRKENTATQWLLVGCTVLLILVSVPLYVTSVWPFALMQSVLSYLMLNMLLYPKKLSRHGILVTFMTLAWLLVFVGAAASPGALTSNSGLNCMAYYGTKGLSMCKSGWITITNILIQVIAALIFLFGTVIAASTYTRQRLVKEVMSD